MALIPTVVLGADPIAGAECSDAVPAGQVWQLLGYAVTLNQGLTQTPLPDFVIDDGTNVLFRVPMMSSALNSSVVADIFGAPTLPTTAGGAATRITFGIPQDWLLKGGYRLRTITAGIGAATDFVLPRIIVARLA